MGRGPKDDEQCCNHSQHKRYFEEIYQGLRFHDGCSDDLEIIIDEPLSA